MYIWIKPTWIKKKKKKHRDETTSTTLSPTRNAIAWGVKRKMTEQRWKSNAITGVFPQPTSTPMGKLPTLHQCRLAKSIVLNQWQALQFPQKAELCEFLMALNDPNSWREEKKSYCLHKNREELKKHPSLVSIRFLNITNLLSIVQRGEWHRYCYKLFISELWLSGYKFPPLKSKSEPHVRSVP